MQKWIGWVVVCGFAMTGNLLASERKMLTYPFPPAEMEIRSKTFFHKEGNAPVELGLVSQTLHDEIVYKSRTLEEKIRQKIFGQDEAIRETTNAIVRYAAGVNDASCPIASLLYCGPSGVGKTELAKQLCLELYGKQSHFIRINMSEYVEAHSITRLIGSPPGYIGYDTGGALTNRLLQNPYSVVLLDEVEKAHPKVLKLFMHVFDAGYLTSSSGQDVDCRNAIFILTSNIAASEIADLFAAGLTHHEILESLQPYLMDILSPEMYNRLDCMVFSPLSATIFEQLVRKILGELKSRIFRSKGIEVLFDDSLVNYLKIYTIDPKLGARPLKRIVEKELTTVIAHAIIESDCSSGDCVLCSYLDGHVCLEVVFTCLD